MPDLPPGPERADAPEVREAAARLVPYGHSYAESHGEGSGIERLLASKQGYIIGRMGNRVLRLDTDGHILTVAPTRSGKGVSCIIPNLLDHPGSAFVIDIRGDTIARTADARLLMGQDVVVLDPYNITEGRWGHDSFNPFDILRPGEPGFEQRVRNMAQAILFDAEGRSSKEPIWDNATMLALNGAITYLKTCVPPEMQTMRELTRLFSLQPERRAKLAEEMARAMATTTGEYEKAVEVFLEFMIAGSEKTKVPDNTVVQLMTVLQWVHHREFESILARSTFSFDRLQTRPTTVYLVLPEEYIKGCEVWVRLLFNAALYQLKEVNSIFGVSSNKLDQSQRVLFLLDEFPAFGRLQPVEDGLATVAGRGATLWLFIQHISQLDRIYQEHSARQIVGNASLIQAFNSNEIHEQEYFSRIVGEEMFDVESVTIGANVTTGGGKGTSHTVTVGNSESRTQGTSRSVTEGQSLTVTEGESTGRSRGTSESVTTGTSESTSDSVSRSKGSNRGTGGNSGGHDGESMGVAGKHYLPDYLGIEIPLRDTKNRSENWGRSWGRNWSRGISDSISKSKNRTRGTSKSRSKSVSETETYTMSHSVARGASRSETEGISDSKTDGTSNSEATGTSENENWSRGENVSYTVKPEQRKIETPRSLRRSMSNGSQLLALRGHYAFIAPRLLFFERSPDPVFSGRVAKPAEFYRFPQMAILAGETSLEAFWEDCVKTYLGSTFTLRTDRPPSFPELALYIEDIVRKQVADFGPYSENSRTYNSQWIIVPFQRLREAIDKALQGDSVITLADTAAFEVCWAFLEFAAQFAGGRGTELEEIAGGLAAIQSGPVRASVPEEVRTLRKLLLFKHGQLESLLRAENAQVRAEHTHWLLGHYEIPARAALRATQDVLGAHDLSSFPAQTDAFVRGALRRIEEARETALEEAALRQIERRAIPSRDEESGS